MLGLLEREILNARRAANLSPEKEARLVPVQDKFHVFWYGDTGEMRFVKKTPTQVVLWDVPSEEADRLLNIGRMLRTEWYREREWIFKDELLDGENLAELRELIANLERESLTA
jgi:hypothetical protein